MKSQKARRTAVNDEAGQKNSAETLPVCKMKHQTWSQSE